MKTLTCRWSTRAVWPIALLLSIFVLTPRTQAQGGMESVPKAITTVDLTAYADRLDLSPAQRQAFEQLHDGYKALFRTLQDGEIAAYLAESASMNSNGIPSRKSVEKVVAGGRALFRKIERLDNQLFDRLTPMLTPDQSSRIERVRLARARVRFGGQSGGMQMFTGNTPPDVSKIYLDLHLDLDDTTSSAADSILSGYESRLTAMMGKQFESSSTMFLRMYDALEEQFGSLEGMDEQSMMEDSERMQELMEVAQRIFMEVTQDSRKLNARTFDLSKRTSQQIESVMLPDDARSLNEAFTMAAYPRTRMLFESQSRTLYDKAILQPDLADETREQLVSFRAGMQPRLDRLVGDYTRLLDKQRKSINYMAMDEAMQELMQEIQERESALQTDAMTLEGDAMTALNDILGTDQIAALGSAEIDAQKMLEAAQLEMLEENEHVYTGDQFVASPMRRREIRDLAGRLQLDDGDRQLMIDLYDDYTTQYRELEAIKAMKAANEKRWVIDPDTGRYTSAGVGQLAAIAVARNTAMDATSATDVELFEMMALAFEFSDVQRQQLDRFAGIRQRTAASGGVQNFYFMNQTSAAEASVDLARLVQEQEWDAALESSINDPLLAWETHAAADWILRRDGQLELMRLQEEWQFESIGELDDPGEVGRRYQAFQKRLAEPTKRIGDLNRAIGERNRSSLEEITSLLPTLESGGLRRAYDRAAFPAIFTDRLAIHDQLDRALELPDLGGSPRGTLIETASMYRAEYARLSQSMIDMNREAPTQRWGAEDFDWAAQQEHERKVARLRFDRNEVCYRAANQLKGLLTELQLASVGGLPEPEEEGQNFYW